MRFNEETQQSTKFNFYYKINLFQPKKLRKSFQFLNQTYEKFCFQLNLII
jgi:hypothetical protein